METDLRYIYIIKDIVNLIEHTFPKNISVIVSIDPNVSLIAGNSTQLHQVLLNLVVNARDAMPHGGQITISLTPVFISAADARTNIDAKPGNYLRLTVSDTGIGILPEHLDKVFDPFFTTKPEGKGTGLGLSTVLSIVRSHGGFVEVDSVPNVGTSFKLYLPTTASTLLPHLTSHVESVKDRGNGEVILVVDDEEAIGEIAAELLQNAGYATLVAKNGEEALSLYQQHYHNIRLVLTDMVMPKMDGASLIRSLRAVEPRVKVIAMSGLIDREKLMKAAGVESSAFITKPFTSETLLKTVYRCLGNTSLGLSF